ncbi:MAG: serine/threonine protein kinase [Blastocatellia bacterium]|nr:serine/threonine protein kinase [Blastocatellia bacterium]
MDQDIAHYRLIHPLGSGSMGQVFKAEDKNLDRKVALKLVSHDTLADRQAQIHLLEEARRAAAINHPHIATIYEAGQHNGLSYIAMEYVEGESLAQIIERGKLDINEALAIALQISEALKAAHDAGLIHCDIKSSNIMLSGDRTVKVLDFGLAKLEHRASPASLQAATETHGNTQTVSIPSTQPTTDDRPRTTEPDAFRSLARPDGISPPGVPGLPFTQATLSGTPAYMSPEQARGLCVDARSDIFSLGVVLFEMLTARKPFEGDSPAMVLRSIIHEEPPPLAVSRNDVPLELESLIRRALEKIPDHRYQSADEIGADLKRLRDRLYLSTSPWASIEREGESGDLNRANLSASGQATLSRWQILSLRHRWFLGPGLLTTAAAVIDALLFSSERGNLIITAALFSFAAACFVAYAALRRTTVGPVRPILTGAAFRGLLPFQEADRSRFYGREVEAASLFDMVTHADFRLGVLYGDSGSGKTSLLRAALLPLLWEEGYVPLYCRSYKDPLAALLEECRKQCQIAIAETERPIDYLRRVTDELDAVLVIVCDQFEEFFVNFRDAAEREPFTRLAAACHNDGNLKVKFLFSMRSDFLYLIGEEFDSLVAEPLASSKRYHLRNLGRHQAAEIIEKSAARAGLPFEPGLSRQVARDLASGGMVLPSELQIVGERLQSKRIYTLQAYRRTGGKEPLVHSFLEEVIEASGDREGAQLLLRCLISEENTRLTLPLEEIARRMQRSPQQVGALLRLFVESRLVREIQEESVRRYELMHEYLIEKINQITGRVMDATQRANRLLRQYASNYAVDRGTRIPLGKLWFIRRYSDMERARRERELLKKSLRWGVVKLCAVVVLLAAAAAAAAAMLSVSEEWEMIRLGDGHTAAARQVAFSPDGKLMVSVGEDMKAIVWDFARRERLATLTGHTDWVTSVAFSPDGKMFATASADHTVIIRDAQTFEKITVLRTHRGPVNAVAFSPDGKLLASASAQSSPPDQQTILWDTARWEKIREAPLGIIHGPLIFSPDSRYLIIRGENGLDLVTGREDKLDQNWSGNWSAFSPDARYVVSVDSYGEVRFSNVEERKLLAYYQAHRDHGRAAAYSPDGRYAATGAEDVILWDAATQTKLLRFEHTAVVWNVNFSPDGHWLVSTHGDGSILLWDVAERERAANFNGHSSAVRTVAFSPDGKRIASASEDRSVIVWDAASGQKEAVLTGHDTRVTAVIFTSDGKDVLSGDQLGNLICWEVDRRKPRWIFNDPDLYKRAAYGIAVSPDGRWVATTHGVYETDDGLRVKDLIEAIQERGTIYGIDFSKDGRQMACTTDQGNLIIFDTEKWEVSDSASLKGNQLITVSYSPDGRWLVTGEDQGALRLWETNPLHEVAIIGNHTARIKRVSFSPDGRQIVSAGDDQSISLWDVSNRSLITRIGTHSAPVLSVAFSPDGKQIVSGEHDNSVRIYTRHSMLWGYRLD